jgi:hypothetical protein
MAPDTWLTILFAVLAVAAYLLWVLELLPGVRVAIALLAVVCFVLALVFYQHEVNAAGHSSGWGAWTPVGTD